MSEHSSCHFNGRKERSREIAVNLIRSVAYRLGQKEGRTIMAIRWFKKLKLNGKRLISFVLGELVQMDE